MNKQIKALVIDDSAVVRNLLSEILETDSAIEVVATAGDPYKAVEKIKQFAPDVITLDVEMPKMSGLQFLKKLMSAYPLPVVMISSLTKRGSKETINALEYGAIDFVAKTNLKDPNNSKQFKAEVLRKVKLAAGVKVRKIKKNRKRKNKKEQSISVSNKDFDSKYIIAIGASTGGVKALKSIIADFPVNSPGIIIIQHMPKEFTASFANTLDSVAQIKVKEAEEGDKISSGQALLAPGDAHVTVNKKGKSYYINLDHQGPKEHHQRPAVDVTFNSLAKVVGNKLIGILLTGMGKDGAQGLKKIKASGGYTIAESEKTATIFGMPKQAINIGAVTEVLPLSKIPIKAISLVDNN